AERAREAIREEKIDLVLAIVHEEKEFAIELAAQAKALRADLPVAILATDPSSLPRLTDAVVDSGVDRVFLWQNDPTLLVAIIKYFEDHANVDHDTSAGGVRVVMLVEDSVAHYSTILPAIYTAIMLLTRRLIDEGLNLLHKQLRMRSRAKIVLADSLEEAVALYRRYRPYVLGVVTDVRFAKAGQLNDEAGFELVRMLRREDRELPICIQSAEPEKNRPRALALGATFIDKNSTRLIEDLQRFLEEYMGFGDFIFRLPDGTEVARAGNPRELLESSTPSRSPISPSPKSCAAFSSASSKPCSTKSRATSSRGSSPGAVPTRCSSCGWVRGPWAARPGVSVFCAICSRAWTCAVSSPTSRSRYRRPS
nr:hypothetical protein [Desulfobacterales bacterium]